MSAWMGLSMNYFDTVILHVFCWVMIVKDEETPTLLCARWKSEHLVFDSLR
jgi:hypothetical protein